MKPEPWQQRVIDHFSPPEKMKCFVMWQPWASLAAVGAKPIEFRKRDYRTMGVDVGQRVAIAAGARAVKNSEALDLLSRLDDELGTTGLDETKARALLARLTDAGAGRRGSIPPHWHKLPMGRVIALATLGEPRPTEELMPKWKPFINDSDRLEHAKWGWPLLDVMPLDGHYPVRGFQGFFNVAVPAGGFR